VVEKLCRGEPVKAFSDQLVSPTLAANGAAMLGELLLETATAASCTCRAPRCSTGWTSPGAWRRGSA
jgi:dTDP-4-dehydrorhamnose reductase